MPKLSIIKPNSRNARHCRQNLKFLLHNAADAEKLGLQDGDRVRVTTKASSAELTVEISPHTTENFVYIRHGRGLIYQNVQYGVNVNELVSSADRDELGTPMHRRVPCKVEKI